MLRRMSREETHGCSQTPGVTNRQQVQPLSRSTALLGGFYDPISAPLTHSLILPLIDFMYGSPRLDHILSNLLHGRVGTDTRIQNIPDLVESSTQIDGSGSGEEEMIEERLDMVTQLEWRSQEIRSWILGEGSRDIRRH